MMTSYLGLNYARAFFVIEGNTKGLSIISVRLLIDWFRLDPDVTSCLIYRVKRSRRHSKMNGFSYSHESGLVGNAMSI